MKRWLENGRLETVLACAVLAAVLILFAKFYEPQTPTQAPAEAIPTSDVN